MRAIYIFIILLTVILNGCASVEVAKEVTKATNSVGTTIKKIVLGQDEVEKDENLIVEDDVEKTENLIIEKEEIITAKKKERAVINKQQDITVINIQGRTLNQLTENFGEPDLIRKDGNTKSVRFNTSSCRVFIYFNLKVNKPKAEYYEIRDINGDLIDKKEKINKCFMEIKKT